MHLFTDASGNKCWGTYWAGIWLQAEWSPEQATQDITWKQLYAVICAANTWGHHWAKKKKRSCFIATIPLW